MIDGVPTLEANADDEQEVVHKNKRKKYGKLCFQQCVDPYMFEKIIEE